MFNFLKRRNLRNEGIICNGLGNAAIEFLKEYERVYIEFWTSDWDDDLKEMGAVHEARYIGKKFLVSLRKLLTLCSLKLKITIRHSLHLLINEIK